MLNQRDREPPLSLVRNLRMPLTMEAYAQTEEGRAAEALPPDCPAQRVEEPVEEPVDVDLDVEEPPSPNRGKRAGKRQSRRARLAEIEVLTHEAFAGNDCGFAKVSPSPNRSNGRSRPDD